jgi:hypothetical protein
MSHFLLLLSMRSATVALGVISKKKGIEWRR